MRGRYRDTPAGEMRTTGLYGALTGPGIKTAGPTPPGGRREGFPVPYANFFHTCDSPQYRKFSILNRR